MASNIIQTADLTLCSPRCPYLAIKSSYGISLAPSTSSLVPLQSSRYSTITVICETYQQPLQVRMLPPDVDDVRPVRCNECIENGPRPMDGVRLLSSAPLDQISASSARPIPPDRAEKGTSDQLVRRELPRYIKPGTYAASVTFEADGKPSIGKDLFEGFFSNPPRGVQPTGAQRQEVVGSAKIDPEPDVEATDEVSTVLLLNLDMEDDQP